MPGKRSAVMKEGGRSANSLRLNRLGAASQAIAVVLVFGISVAQAVPLATSTLYLQAGRTSFDGQVHLGPDAAPLAAQPLPYYESHVNPDGSISYGSATGSAAVDFTGPLLGAATASASASAGGQFERANGGGSGEFDAALVVDPRQVPPFAPTSIPISFATKGAVSGDASVYMGIQGVGQFYTSSGSLDERETWYLDTFDPRYPYFIYVIANANAFASVGYNETVTSSSWAWADPTIVFDQAAFDQLYGNSAFNLADYYALEFSPDLVVSTIPESRSVAVLGLALAALGLAGGIGRREITADVARVSSTAADEHYYNGAIARRHSIADPQRTHRTVSQRRSPWQGTSAAAIGSAGRRTA
jgi:hypothetical protein